MTTFTCISCHVLFSTAALQREHYKTDWHRYNLMRKVAELPPVTNEVFQQKAAAQKELQESSKEEDSSYCADCRKYFGTKNAFQNHLKSKKHVEAEDREKQKTVSDVVQKNIKNLEKSSGAKPSKTKISISSDKSTSLSEKDDDWESADDDDEDAKEESAISATHCLFCSHESESLESNISHMTQSHSFFIPDLEYLTDLEGLVTYLGEKVGLGNMCLWCSQRGKAFQSLHAVQQHMLDKGHCKMLHEGEALLEYSDFYDYSASYPAGDKEDGDAKADENPEEEIDADVLDADNWQLVLPSGATIGHRSLSRYYRQNVPPTRPASSQKLVHRLMHQYRALGWTGTTGEVAVKKAQDIKFMRKMQAKQSLKLGVKANKFQPHFRQQVMF